VCRQPRCGYPHTVFLRLMAKGRQEGAGRSGAIFSSLQAPGPRRLGKRLVVFCGWGRAISTTPRERSGKPISREFAICKPLVFK
jgi:hypothetical protein